MVFVGDSSSDNGELVSESTPMRGIFEALSSFAFTIFSLLIASFTTAFFGIQVAVIVLPIVTALAFYASMHAFSRRSGGFVNPLLTILYALRKVLAPAEAAVLVAFEFVGAFLAAGVAYLILPSSASFQKSRWFDLASPGYGATSPVAKFFSSSGLEFSAVTVLLFHALILFLLFFSTRDEFELTAFSVFSSVVLVPSVLLSGSSLNPARDIAVAVFGRSDGGVVRAALISLVALIVVGAVWALEFPVKSSPFAKSKTNRGSNADSNTELGIGEYRTITDLVNPPQQQLNPGFGRMSRQDETLDQDEAVYSTEEPYSEGAY
jgi:glycerol uptake facilitator-like aquaporin